MKSAFFLLFILTQILYGQVNTEKYRYVEDSLGFSGIVKLAASIQTGNTDLQELGTEILLENKKPESTILLILNGDYGWNNGQQFSDEALAHLRFVHALNQSLKFEIFTQANYDKSLLLLFRSLGGAGLRFKLFETKHSVLWFGSAYMIEYERYSAPRRFIDKKEILAHRWSNYLSYNLIIQKNVSISSVIYYQPRFDLWKDTRILTENSLIVNLSRNFSLSVDFDLRYDRFTPAGIKEVDTKTKIGFIYNF
ncbi:MAG: DUF481 domain-containing protein [Ignavibacteriaceae bacterium]|jgi:hypothetical protein